MKRIITLFLILWSMVPTLVQAETSEEAFRIDAIEVAASATAAGPGDLGRKSAEGAFVLLPDGQIDRSDYELWLMIYKAYRSGGGTTEWLQQGDLNDDGKINNKDFSAWLTMYKTFSLEEGWKS